MIVNIRHVGLCPDDKSRNVAEMLSDRTCFGLPVVSLYEVLPRLRGRSAAAVATPVWADVRDFRDVSAVSAIVDLLNIAGSLLNCWSGLAAIRERRERPNSNR
jgi:hypothetical protein